MEALHTMPELGFQKKATDAAFASNVLESLDDIYNSRNVSNPFSFTTRRSSVRLTRRSASLTAHLSRSGIETHCPRERHQRSQSRRCRSWSCLEEEAAVERCKLHPLAGQGAESGVLTHPIRFLHSTT